MLQLEGGNTDVLSFYRVSDRGPAQGQVLAFDLTRVLHYVARSLTTGIR